MKFNVDKGDLKIIRNFINPLYIKLLQTYFDLKYKSIHHYEEEKLYHTLRLDQGDVADSLGFYGDMLTETISELYRPEISRELELDLSPTYTYARIYEKGRILVPHIDRPACEISMSCPITISDNTESTIYISNYRHTGRFELSIEDVKRRGDYTRVDLQPGDVVIYSGCNRLHWREPIESEYIIQFFMHYVITGGINYDCVYDHRPYIGFPMGSGGPPRIK
jgi:hypothetical protein